MTFGRKKATITNTEFHSAIFPSEIPVRLPTLFCVATAIIPFHALAQNPNHSVEGKSNKVIKGAGGRIHETCVDVKNIIRAMQGAIRDVVMAGYLVEESYREVQGENPTINPNDLRTIIERIIKAHKLSIECLEVLKNDSKFVCEASPDPKVKGEIVLEKLPKICTTLLNIAKESAISLDIASAMEHTTEGRAFIVSILKSHQKAISYCQSICPQLDCEHGEAVEFNSESHGQTNQPPKAPIPTTSSARSINQSTTAPSKKTTNVPGGL